MHWYLDVLKRYVDFNGRARRQEYWMFALINFVIILVLAFIDQFVGLYGAVLSLYILAVFLPTLGVTVRRLHDTNHSGLWFLVGCIPCVGLIVLYFLVLDSDAGDNQYGRNPKLA